MKVRTHEHEHEQLPNECEVSSGHEQLEYRGLVKDPTYRDQDCDYKNIWLNGCLPFEISESLESHRGSQIYNDKDDLTDSMYEKYGHKELVYDEYDSTDLMYAGQDYAYKDSSHAGLVMVVRALAMGNLKHW